MKEIKAFLHRNRVADIVHALQNSSYCNGTCNLSVMDVTGSLRALDDQEKHFSIELGQEVVNEVKLELVCDDERVAEAVQIIRENGRTGQRNAGWVYVTDISEAYPISDE